MENTAILVRTNKLDHNVDEIIENIKPYFKNIFIVLERFNDESIYLTFSDNVLTMGGRFLKEKGLYTFSKVGWQCGDYAFYAASEILKGFDYYWIVEPDLRLNTNVAVFFDKFESVDSDLLGINYGIRDNRWGWYNSISSFYDKVYGMYFPFLRLSKRAIDLCYKERITYSDSEYVKKLKYNENRIFAEFSNDESFVATTLTNHGYKCENFSKYIDREIFSYFSTDIPILRQEIGNAYLENKILHPVLDNRDRLKSKLKGFIKRYPEDRVNKRKNEIINTIGIDNWNDLVG